MNVDLFITRKCSQGRFCGFCNAPWNAFPADASREKLLLLADQLKVFGAKVVTICGGEPFECPHLFEVVKRLHSLGIEVVLYTNATSDAYDIKAFIPYIKILSLPIDAVTPEVAAKMRGVHQLEAVQKKIESLMGVIALPRIKIGTVVTKQNAHDVANIGAYLEGLHDHGIDIVWRLYQFSPHGLGAKNEEKFLISDADFALATASAESVAVQVSRRSRDDMIGYCMIMDPHGNFYRYKEQYVPIGMTVWDNPSVVAAQYDAVKHSEQKAWLSS